MKKEKERKLPKNDEDRSLPSEEKMSVLIGSPQKSTSLAEVRVRGFVHNHLIAFIIGCFRPNLCGPFIIVFFLSSLTIGCSPKVYSSTHRVSYRSTAPCSQGPMELVVNAGGYHWGEEIELFAYSPRDITGYYEVVADGKVLRRGRWSTEKEVLVRDTRQQQAQSQRGRSDVGSADRSTSDGAGPEIKQVPVYVNRGLMKITGPENRRCLASKNRPSFSSQGEQQSFGEDSSHKNRSFPSDVSSKSDSSSQSEDDSHREDILRSETGAADESDATREDGETSYSKNDGEPYGDSKDPVQKGLGTEKKGNHVLKGLEKTSWAIHAANWPHTIFKIPIVPSLGSYRDKSSCYARHMAKRSIFKKGSKILIRLWSAQPNDLEGVVFTLRHRRLLPSKGFKERQEKRFRACLKKHPDEKKRWEAMKSEKKKRDELDAAAAAQKARRKVCYKYFASLLKDAEGRPYGPLVIKDCYCLKMPGDETCWGKGGMEGWRERYINSPPTEGQCTARRQGTRWGFTNSVSMIKPCRCFQSLQDKECWGEGGYDVYEKNLLDKAFKGSCRKEVMIVRKRRAAASRRAGKAENRSGKKTSSSPPIFHAKYFFTINRPCNCYGRLKDESCWGEGGYEGFLRRLKEQWPEESICRVQHMAPHPESPRAKWLLPIKKPCKCFGDLQDRKCWGEGGYGAHVRSVEKRYKKLYAESKARRGGKEQLNDADRAEAEAAAKAMELERRRAEADRRYEKLWRRETAVSVKTEPVIDDQKLPPKPPPPKKELKPDSPSKNAKWIPGYWHRSGGRWHWISGWWRVPQADVSAGLTVKTDLPPPTRRRKKMGRRSSKIAGLVWIPGHWHWHRGKYIWIPGRYRVPPSPHHIWRPPRWRRVPGGAVFVPGAWVLPKR